MRNRIGRLLFVFSFQLMLVSIAFAQDSAKISVQYKLTYVIDTTVPETPDIAYFSLFIGKNSSKYIDYIDENSNTVFTTIISRQPLYKNFSTNKIIREISMGPQTIYAITAEIPQVDWEVGKEQKKILGYNCQSASGTYRGRTYTAWFTTQLPYRNGPWKLGGLPGLILEMYDANKEIIWKAEKISTQIDPILSLIRPNKNAISVTPEEYKKLNDALKKDAAAMRGSATSAAPNTGVSVSVVPHNSTTSTGRKWRTFNNPIEKN